MSYFLNLVFGNKVNLIILAILALFSSSCFFNANIGVVVADEASTTDTLPAKLVFIKQPIGHVAPLALLSQQPILELQDSEGNRIVSGPFAQAKISLQLSSGSGVLGGTLVSQAIAGRFELTDLTLDQEGEDKRLTASLDLSDPNLSGLRTPQIRKWQYF